ncbi:MAG: hypothetical protein AAF430_05270 [Myxococcota bacterium]
MANRIAQIHQGGVSVWDVLLPLRTGNVQADHRYHENHTAMLNAALNRTDVNIAEFTWQESMEILLKWFQQRVVDRSSPFYDVKSLYFVKLGLHEKGRQLFVSFQTEFWDEHEDEQDYIDEMSDKYREALEVFWRHCEGVDLVFENPAPAHQLSTAFVDLVVRTGLVDNHSDKQALTFFVQHTDTSPTRIDELKQDNERLLRVGTELDRARESLDGLGSDAREAVEKLLNTLDPIVGTPSGSQEQ